RVDLADVVGRDVLRPVGAGSALGVDPFAVPQREPVRGLLLQHALDVVLRTGVTGRQVEVAPVAAVLLRRGRVPRVVRGGKPHPTRPNRGGGAGGRGPGSSGRPPSRCGTGRAGSG